MPDGTKTVREDLTDSPIRTKNAGMSTQVVENFPTDYRGLIETQRELNTSTATVERMVRDGRLRSKLVPRPGRKPERVYLAEDIDRLKEQKGKRRELRPPSALVPRSPASTQQLALVTTELVRQLAAPKPIPLSEKLWLSLPEAQAYSGLAKTDLLVLAQSKRVVARKSGGWKIQRKSLEAFGE